MRLLILFFCAPLIFANELALQEFTKANNEFSSSVYKEIIKGPQGNFLVSPFSAETILAFTHSGTKGETAQELQNALHLPEDSKIIEEGIKAVLPKIRESDKYILRTANKMYVKNGFQIKDDFQRIATDVFSAKTENIDFTQNADAAQTMNNWVKEKTENKIQNLISSKVLNNDTRVVLINALYFKANWAQRFHLIYTKEMDFYKTPTEVVKVKTLYNAPGQRFLFTECPHLKAKFLELPFKGEEASMTIILPNDKNGLEKLESEIDRALMPHNVTKQLVIVGLPKFKIETKINLKKILKNLGANLVFKHFEADLSGIAGEKGDLVVSEVVQKTFIDVSEKGVEAAAATYAAVAVPMSGMLRNPKKFIADHPFIFYIKVKGVIVFVGRVTDPSI